MRHIPRKRFGQHFLVDGGVIADIVNAIHPQPGDAMVEIGPGLSAMTQPLWEGLAPSRLTVIELDRDLAARLRRAAKVDVIEADVLNVDFTALRASAVVSGSANGLTPSLRVVGNLPYNISTPILFHLLQHRHAIQDQHFMLQLEVIERLVAQPGDSEYSRLSVMLQAHYDMENLFTIGPEAFDPPPRVDSAIVRMVPLAQALVRPEAQGVFGELVAAAFSQRRKLLRHSLGAWLLGRGTTTTAEALGFGLQRRAQEVPVAEYAALAHALVGIQPQRPI